MLLKSSLSFYLILLACVSTLGKEWRGIIPLHSSKQDVERLLGPPKSRSRYVSSYEFNGEFVDIYYASGPPCGNGLTNSWKVPPGTVVSIRVTTKNTLRFDSVVTDASGYSKSVDSKDPRRVYYYDEEQGVRYTVRVDQQSSVQDVMNVDYLPSKNDDRLKCFSAKSARGGSSLPPFEKFGYLSIAKRNAILDNFAIQLELDRQLRGLIIAHDGRIRSDDASKAARNARNYLVHVRRVEPDRVVAITGARRDELMVELYLLPKDAPTPVLTKLTK
jgi:hypothetical protein